MAAADTTEAEASDWGGLTELGASTLERHQPSWTETFRQGVASYGGWTSSPSVVDKQED